MKRILRHPIAWAALGLTLLAVLFSVYDRHERIRQGEEIQQELLGRVIARRDSLLSMHPDIFPFGGGSFEWDYRLAPGQFDRERAHCIDAIRSVDPGANRAGVPLEDRRQCFLAYRDDDRVRTNVQIILGDATLAVSLINY